MVTVGFIFESKLCERSPCLPTMLNKLLLHKGGIDCDCDWLRTTEEPASSYPARKLIHLCVPKPGPSMSLQGRRIDFSKPYK